MVLYYLHFQRRLIDQQMKNQFVPNFSFQKKDMENFSKVAPAFLHKNAVGSQDYLDRRANNAANANCLQRDSSSPGKQAQTTEEESINSQEPGSCTSCQTTTKPSAVQQKLRREHRIISPIKYEDRHYLNNRPTISPSVKESRVSNNHFVPIRATLKNILSKTSPNKNEDNFNTQGTISNKQIQLNGSFRANKTLTEFYKSPTKNMQKENQILKEENELLRRQLSEIKKNLMFGNINKKEDLISNLRNTIKKEDNQNKELKIKLELCTKKNLALTTLIENKDEEIDFLSSKVFQMEQQLQQLKDHKEKTTQRFQKLKDRINYTLKSYNDLQCKWSRSQVDWLGFQQKWMQQKSIYLNRIAFLEQYISRA